MPGYNLHIAVILLHLVWLRRGDIEGPFFIVVSSKGIMHMFQYKCYKNAELIAEKNYENSAIANGAKHTQ